MNHPVLVLRRRSDQADLLSPRADRTQRARRLRSRTTVATSVPWSSSPPSELRITRVFSCVARGLKARASFMFAGDCRWLSLAVDGSSGASRGHAPVVRRPGSRWGGAVERPSAFQRVEQVLVHLEPATSTRINYNFQRPGRCYHQISGRPPAQAAGRCCLLGQRHRRCQGPRPARSAPSGRCLDCRGSTRT
jgi:hypothetical protein